jgi:short-subunit dehydrogenase
MGGLMSGIPFIGPYAATKVAVVSISETLRREMEIAGLPIGVSVLCPGVVETRVMESERGRPEHRGAEERTEMAESVRLMIRDSFTAPTSQQPAQVAARVLDAVRADELWILTHGSERAIVEERTTAILAAFPQEAPEG